MAIIYYNSFPAQKPNTLNYFTDKAVDAFYVSDKLVFLRYYRNFRPKTRENGYFEEHFKAMAFVTSVLESAYNRCNYFQAFGQQVI